MRRAHRFVLVGAALAALACAPVGAADTAPIADSPDLPWTNPSHQSSLEQLLGPIASHIAARAVTVRCEGDTDWTALVTEAGGDPSSELGYVAASFGAASGRLVSLATFTELDGGRVCLPLKRFAVATTKPTKCSATTTSAPTFVKQRVQGHVVVTVHGKPHLQTIWYTKTVARPGVTTTAPPGPCYLGGRQTAAAMPPSFWSAYADYAWAILTLAHESIHLGGIVGGKLSNGVLAGDQQAEAKANCYGMQWMPYVAEQLGDTADDAQAIAEFFWDTIYPTIESSAFPEYWSADCVPGGALDIRPAGTTAWP